MASSTSLRPTGRPGITVFFPASAQATKNVIKVPTAVIAPATTKNGNTTPNDDEKNDWMDVVHTRRTACVTDVAFKTNMALSGLPPDCPYIYTKAFIEKGLVANLNPSQTYKIRVAAVNSLGVGPWSEVASYGINGTAKQGLLGAPTNVKISRTIDGGALLSWDPPAVAISDVSSSLEYCVFLEQEKADKSSKFEDIWHGTGRNCLISRDLLTKAKVDRKEERPCIMFRIAAILGELESTMQVRWLQDDSPKSKKGDESQS